MPASASWPEAAETAAWCPIEDPIESDVEGVAQSQVNPGVGLDLAQGLRFLMRQDPEVIMVGEIRDRATAEAALQASLTGHLLLSTFHAGSAAETAGRLLDMGLEPYVLRSGLLAILNQRLLRRLCSCARPAQHRDDRLGLPVHRAMVAGGCAECAGTGYRGRFLLVEMLTFSRRRIGARRARAVRDRDPRTLGQPSGHGHPLATGVRRGRSRSDQSGRSAPGAGILRRFGRTGPFFLGGRNISLVVESGKKFRIVDKPAGRAPLISQEQRVNGPGSDPLLAGLAAGDQRAFAALYDRFGMRMYRAALRILDSPEDAEDAVQDVFLAVARARETLFEVRDLAAYLFAALHHAAARVGQRRVRGLERSLTAAEEPICPAAPSAAETPEWQRVQLAVRLLPESQREVLSLKIDAELTFAQIAEATGVSIGTVVSRYRYALEKLRSSLGAASNPGGR